VSTGEELRTTYWANGSLIAGEYEKICWLLRDVTMMKRLAELERSGRPKPAGWFALAAIDVDLLDVLYALNAWLNLHGVNKPLQILSGFRHMVTNSALEGAAQLSEHTRGAAADLHVPGIQVQDLGQFGQWLGGGGVGFYPSRGFLHLDSGRVRTWSGSQSRRRR
jgi:uncharacterized protein YcbK (DUF882 family)